MAEPEPGFRRFVESRSTALLRTAVLLCSGDRGAAERLVRTATTKTYLAWGRIRRPEAAEPYARSVLARAALGRTQPARPAPGAPGTLTTAALGPEDLARLEDRLELWPYLAGLPGLQRAVVVLRYHDGLCDDEIAQVLTCSRRVVTAAAADALAVLRQQGGDA